VRFPTADICVGGDRWRIMGLRLQDLIVFVVAGVVDSPNKRLSAGCASLRLGPSPPSAHPHSLNQTL